MKREELETKTKIRARESIEFRAALLKDPKAVIKKEFGVELPGDLDYKVIEESGKTNYLVIPTSQNEVSDADLDKVGGGMVVCSFSW